MFFGCQEKLLLLSLTSISIREIYILLLFWMFYIILRSGDVEIQPGPLSSCSSVFSDEMSESDIDKFSFVHYNIQSIKNKVDLLSIELRAFDIISLTETWLNDESEVPETLFENFKHPYTYIRTNQVGGGISVYVKNSIFSTRRPDLEVRGPHESVWIELKIKNKTILFGTFYRPPNCSIDSWDFIEHSIDLAHNTGIADILITGDLNENQLIANNNRVKNINLKYSFTQLINEPTHYTESSSSLLDVIITSDSDIIHKAYVSEHFLPADIRYHCPIVGILNIEKVKAKSFKRLIWLYDDGDYDRFREMLNSQDWDTIIQSNHSINDLAQEFTKILSESAKQTIPNKNVTIRKNDPPWMRNNVRKLIRKRKRAHRKAKKRNTPYHWEKFRKIRNEVIASVRKAKADYEYKITADINNGDMQSKSWWKKSI